ncbi:MAG: ketopantoate reductase family protein [Alkalibacterium sp.]|nr:ketopantoate reductase family protein [Alkalibacterium sp.]TVP89789.1 MAG: ketopantoate reductase family protein [Alkalibacterium sp.]
MRVLIYGAGPFGSLFAERLKEAHHDVTLLARGDRLRQLREHGVVIKDHETEEITVTRVPVVETLEEEDEYDLIIVPMRKNQALEILPVLKKNKHVPTVLFMMNNAAGSQELVKALGKDRVMIGFPLPGGKREGHIMRMLPVNDKNKWTLPIGEVNGEKYPRTQTVAAVLDSMRGYSVDIRKDMDDWLICHVAILIVSFVPAVYATGQDLERFARTRDAIILAIRGQKEAFKALRSAGVKMSPAAVVRFLDWTPEPLMIQFWRKALEMDVYKVAVAHLDEAQDEMYHLYKEFRETIKSSDVPTPNLDELEAYFDSQTPPLPDGSKTLSPNWTGVKRGLIGASAAVALGLLLKRKK